MKIGIIGSEEKKFTPNTMATAIQAIGDILQKAGDEPVVVSGHCHLGGVDIWAEELADKLKIPKLIFAPEVHEWNGGTKIGYKQRNIQIAQASDTVVVIAVSSLPPGYPPEPWNRRPCYHCMQRRQIPPIEGASGYTTRHIKSGACWTAWYAIEQMGKTAKWIII